MRLLVYNLALLIVVFTAFVAPVEDEATRRTFVGLAVLILVGIVIGL